MKDVMVACRIAILAYTLGALACGLVGVILLILRKMTANREKEVEQI